MSHFLALTSLWGTVFWRILDSDWSKSFWTTTQELLEYKKVHLNGLDLCQNPKNLIFWAIFGLFGPSWPIGIVFIKTGFVTFLTTWLPNVMQKIRKFCGVGTYRVKTIATNKMTELFKIRWTIGNIVGNEYVPQQVSIPFTLHNMTKDEQIWLKSWVSFTFVWIWYQCSKILLCCYIFRRVH